jgi:hypothetical protein
MKSEKAFTKAILKNIEKEILLTGILVSKKVLIIQSIEEISCVKSLPID